MQLVTPGCVCTGADAGPSGGMTGSLRPAQPSSTTQSHMTSTLFGSLPISSLTKRCECHAAHHANQLRSWENTCGNIHSHACCSNDPGDRVLEDLSYAAEGLVARLAICQIDLL